jgi:hypothetical protein
MVVFTRPHARRPAEASRARVLLAVVGKFVERGAPVIYALPTDFGWKVVRLDEPR